MIAPTSQYIVGGDVRIIILLGTPVKLIKMCQTIPNDEKSSLLSVEIDSWGVYLAFYENP